MIDKTKLREERENCIKFLYILEVGGEYERDEIDDDIYNRVSDIINKTDDIEDIISRSLTGYTINRLNLVDKAILKYSVYEMKYLNTPIEVAINEALEITKKYSDIDGKQVKFSNKVLDKAKDIIINSGK